MKERKRILLAGDNLYRVTYHMSATGQAEYTRLIVARDAGEAEKAVEHCFRVELIEDDISLSVPLEVE